MLCPFPTCPVAMNPALLPLASPAPAPPSGRFSGRPTFAVAGMLCALVLSVSACSQPQAQNSVCGFNDQRAAQPSFRLLVSFRSSTQGDAPEVLEQLQSRANACVRYVSSVSPILHVYAVMGDTDMQTVRQQWLQWSAVSGVDADARMDKH